jgi:hypothetical protein
MLEELAALLSQFSLMPVEKNGRNAALTEPLLGN